MSVKLGVGSVTGPVEVTTDRRVSGGPTDADRVRQAATQFEGIFVRQLLDAANLMGKRGQDKGTGQYGSFAVEALADGVVRAGGLGLVKQIEGSISQTLARAQESAPAQEIEPKTSRTGESRRSEKQEG